MDEVIFIDDDTENEEEQFMLIRLYLNVLYSKVPDKLGDSSKQGVGDLCKIY